MKSIYVHNLFSPCQVLNHHHHYHLSSFLISTLLQTQSIQNHIAFNVVSCYQKSWWRFYHQLIIWMYLKFIHVLTGSKCDLNVSRIRLGLPQVWPEPTTPKGPKLSLGSIAVSIHGIIGISLAQNKQIWFLGKLLLV